MARLVEAADGLEDGVHRFALAKADDDARFGLLEQAAEQPVVLVVGVVAQNRQLLVDADVLHVGVVAERLHPALAVTP